VSAKITRSRAAREWTRWAGHGNGRLGEVVDGALSVLDFANLYAGAWRGDVPMSVTGRVRYVRRGGSDITPGEWREAASPVKPVTVVLDGKDRFVESRAGSNVFTVPLSELTPLGTLDYPRRPRATTSNGTELKSGVVVRAENRIVSLLLLQESDVAVLAILQGWPLPTDLPPWAER
jgi:hypothetical protein